LFAKVYQKEKEEITIH